MASVYWSIQENAQTSRYECDTITTTSRCVHSKKIIHRQKIVTNSESDDDFDDRD